MFRGNFCDRAASTQTITISDPGGNSTPFTVTPSSTWHHRFALKRHYASDCYRLGRSQCVCEPEGTVVATISFDSSATGVNPAQTVRVLVNSMQPSQRGIFVDVPGTVVDLLADPKRNFLLRSPSGQERSPDLQCEQQHPDRHAAHLHPAQGHGDYLRSAISPDRLRWLAHHEHVRPGHFTGATLHLLPSRRITFNRWRLRRMRSSPPSDPEPVALPPSTRSTWFIAQDLPLPTLGVWQNHSGQSGHGHYPVVVASSNGAEHSDGVA